MERVTTYMYTGKELGRVRMWERYKEESGAQGDKVCLFVVGVVCEVSAREPHN